MKILHLPYSFFPYATGGKEVFVYQLIKNSDTENQHVVLIHSGTEKKQYQYEGVNVQVLPQTITYHPRHTYYNSVYDHLAGFETFIAEYQPDAVHFHDQGEGASLSHLLACKKAGIKTLLTYHSPGQSCLQRSLLFTGTTPCDGKIDLTRCTYCRNVIAGMPKPLAKAISGLPMPFDSAGRFVKRNSTQLFKSSFDEFYSLVDAIQVHAHWVEEMLLLNNVPAHKIHFVAMGGHTSLPKIETIFSDTKKPLKLAFVGRCTDIKGVHLLIEAIQMLPSEVAVEVHSFGPYWNDTDYGKKMLSLIDGDKRFHPPRLVPQDEIINELKKMDACVIPSLWPETGPFTVFDAFAAQLPIIGTNYAGIAERVKDGVNGLLFEWNNNQDLSNKISRIYKENDLLVTLKKNITPNRTFTAMASDFKKLYTSI